MHSRYDWILVDTCIGQPSSYVMRDTSFGLMPELEWTNQKLFYCF